MTKTEIKDFVYELLTKNDFSKINTLAGSEQRLLLIELLNKKTK